MKNEHSLLIVALIGLAGFALTLTLLTLKTTKTAPTAPQAPAQAQLQQRATIGEQQLTVDGKQITVNEALRQISIGLDQIKKYTIFKEAVNKTLERVMNCGAEKHRDFAASGPRRGDFGPPSCQKLREIRDYSS